MRRSSLTIVLSLFPFAAYALTTSVPSGSSCSGGAPTLCVIPIGVHPADLEGRKPLVEHVPLHNTLSFEVDFTNGGSQALTFSEGRARFLDEDGDPVLPEYVFGATDFDDGMGNTLVVRVPASGQAAGSGATIPGGERIILFFPLAEIDHNIVPATIDVDLCFLEFTDGNGQCDPLSFQGIALEEYRSPAGQTYIYPTQPPAVPGGEWYSGGGHERDSGHRRGGLRRSGNTVWGNQRYAYDIDVVVGNAHCDDGNGNSGIACNQNPMYFCWGEPVLAMADGQVVMVIQGNIDNPEPLCAARQDCSQCDASYNGGATGDQPVPLPAFSNLGSRCQFYPGAGFCNNQPDAGLCSVFPPFDCGEIEANGMFFPNFPGSGNQVVLLHPNGEFSTYAHMMQGSNDHLACDQFVSQGDVLGNMGMTGTGSNPHMHFSELTTPGPEASIAENTPRYFNNVQFVTPGQTVPRRQLDTSLPSDTRITAILTPPSPIASNPPSPPGAVAEAEPNNTLALHQALSLPATVQGTLEQGEVGDLAVRGDGIEDVYRVNLADPSVLQIDLTGFLPSQNLDVYVVDENLRVLNPTRQGTTRELSERMCLVLEDGAYYPLVTNAESLPSAGSAYTLALAAGDAPVLTVPGTLDFGDVCVGSTGTEHLAVCNTGGDTPSCRLEVGPTVSSDDQFAVSTPSSGYPLEISSDFCFPLQVTFAPDAPGPQSGTLAIPSNDPDAPLLEVQVSGNGAEPSIVVTGSTDFGDVCAGTLAEKTVSVCNVGPCPLEVTGASVNCADFTLIGNPFPTTLGPSACVDLVVGFTPTEAGFKSCTLTIASDDPDTPVIQRTLTAITPFPEIDVPPDLGFPPEVIQDAGACSTALPFPVSNTGQCALEIEAFAISAGAGEYAISGLPSFPILLAPGHVAGEGDLTLDFAPDVVDRARPGEVSVTYVSEPILGETTTVTRDLCGEGVFTGARVLVTHGGIPVPLVKKIIIRRVTGNSNRNRLDTVDTEQDVTLQVVTPPGPCGAFQYHREYGTASNPIQLLPGSYIVSATVRIDGKVKTQTVGFDVSTCDFNPTVVVAF